MDPDLTIVTGLGMAWLAVPLMVAAFAEMRMPKGSGVLFLLGVALIVIGAVRRPAGLPFSHIPEVFFGTLSRLLY